MDDNEPFEQRVSEFVLDEREDARVRDSAIVDQVDDVMRVLSTQIIGLHHLSLSSVCAGRTPHVRTANPGNGANASQFCADDFATRLVTSNHGPHEPLIMCPSPRPPQSL